MNSHLTTSFSRTTWAQASTRKKTFLDPSEARDDRVSGWQQHWPVHMQTICTSLKTDNHASTTSLNFYGPDALPLSKHWRQLTDEILDKSLFCIL